MADNIKWIADQNPGPRSLSGRAKDTSLTAERRLIRQWAAIFEKRYFPHDGIPGPVPVLLVAVSGWCSFRCKNKCIQTGVSLLAN